MNRKKWIAMFLISLVCVTAAFGDIQTASAIAKASVTISKRGKTTAALKLTKLKNVTGYQIFVSETKKGKYKQVGSTRTTSFTLTKLKKNKIYYVKARAYKTSGSRIATGKYSAVVKIGKYTNRTTAEKYAAEVLQLVNEERAKAGLTPLKENKSLAAVAMIRAEELESSFSHTRPDGRDCFTALTDADIVYSSVGENIASGQATSKEVVEDWMSSDGHRANILSEDYTELGVGYYYSAKGSKYYWVQLFIR